MKPNPGSGEGGVDVPVSRPRVATAGSASCCRPTAGTVNIDRTGGQLPGTATWTFGPSCGTVMRNAVTVTLPACE